MFQLICSALLIWFPSISKCMHSSENVHRFTFIADWGVIWFFRRKICIIPLTKSIQFSYNFSHDENICQRIRLFVALWPHYNQPFHRLSCDSIVFGRIKSIGIIAKSRRFSRELRLLSSKLMPIDTVLMTNQSENETHTPRERIGIEFHCKCLLLCLYIGFGPNHLVVITNVSRLCSGSSSD